MIAQVIHLQCTYEIEIILYVKPQVFISNSFR